MTKVLRVSPEHTLPVAVLADSTAIIGRKRSGKSNNAAVMVEEALGLGLQTLILDPKGDWWGITSSADGKAEGYPVVILGGKHATLKLNPYAGTAVADWIIRTGYSVLVDLSQLEPNEIERFCSDLLTELRRLKTETPGPLLIVIDEADELAPEDQRERVHVLKTMGRIIWMVKRGGFVGIGTLVITQRPASLSKNVLTQTEVLVVLQTTGAQDLDAIGDGLKHHVPGATRKERQAALEDLIREVVKLDKGVAVVVSGQILKGILKIPFRRRKTFDSGATPEFGKAIRTPKVVATVAIEKLEAEMARAVEEAKSNDPQVLRQTIRHLQEQLRAMPKQQPPAPTTKPVPVMTAKERAAFERLASLLARSSDDAKKLAEELKVGLSGWEHDLGKAAVEARRLIERALSTDTMSTAAGAVRGGPAPAAVRVAGIAKESRRSPGSGEGRAPERTPATRTEHTGGGLTRGQQRIVDALAWLESAGIPNASRSAIAALAGVSPTSGSYSVDMNRAKDGGLVWYPRPGLVQLTPAGRENAHGPDVALTVAELHRKLEQKLPRAQWAIIAALIEVYPTGPSRKDLAEHLGVAVTSGSYSVNLSTLKDYGFVTYPQPGFVQAAPVLFLERDEAAAS